MIQQRMRRRLKYPRDHDLERLDLVLQSFLKAKKSSSRWLGASSDDVMRL